MKNLKIGKSDLTGSEIILGCMRISSLELNEIEILINSAIENGINFFDHADIYGGGVCEELFGKAFKGKREDIIIQSKCGIKTNALNDGSAIYDLSKDYIINCVDKSLKRLNTDYLDSFLLHRPDALVEPEEVAEAFTILYETGKVRHFGVSNHNPHQIELLKKYTNQELIINQLQFGLKHSYMVDLGINVNTHFESAISYDEGILDYSRLNEITIQAWSPFLFGFFEGVFLDNEKFPEVNSKLDEISKKYNVSKTSIATAWILRHPAKMQVISGTTKPSRLKEICDGTGVSLSREEWYEIYLSAGNKLP